MVSDVDLLARAGVSRREAEVLSSLATHRTHVEIAAELFISVRTVESHVASLRRKLDLPDHRSLVRFAVQHTSATGGRPELASSGRLPVALTSFVGRRDERSRLATALTEARMVSAIGPGGVGKTRLAITVAGDIVDRFPGGVWYVDLVPVTDPSFVPTAVATAFGVTETAGRTVQDLLAIRFDGRGALLLLDNCEHLANSVAVFVERLLSASADIDVLVTSRVRLVVPHERVFRVGGLALDNPADDSSNADDTNQRAGGDAAILFAERAVAAGCPPFSRGDWKIAAPICRALDGQALAIELAAARLPVLGWEALQQALADQISLLEGGARANIRHRSLHDTLDWSYRLLTVVDQTVLRRVSVFASSFTANAAAEVVAFEGVVAGDVPGALGRLADHSLLGVVDVLPVPRYRALEVVRQYGSEQVEVSGDSAVYTEHLRWCVHSAGTLDSANLDVEVFDSIVDDLRAAAAWAAEHSDVRADAHRLVRVLADLLFSRGRASEAQQRYEQAADLADDQRDAVTLLQRAAATAACRVAGEDMVRLYERAADVAVASGDSVAAAFALARGAESIVRFQGMFAHPLGAAVADEWLGQAIACAADDPRANAAILAARANLVDPHATGSRALVEQAIEAARLVGDPVVESSSLDALLLVLLDQGDLVEAASAMASRVAILAVLPKQPDVALELKDALHVAVLSSIGAGDVPGARHYAEQQLALPYLREEHDLAIETLLAPEALAGNFDRVRILSEQFHESWQAAGAPSAPGRGIAPAAVAMVHGMCGDRGARDEWLDVLSRIRAVPLDQATLGCGYGGLFDAMVLMHQGEHDQARRVLARETANLDRWYWMLLRHWYVALDAEAAVLSGNSDAAQLVYQASRHVAGNLVCTAIVDRASALLRDDHASLMQIATVLGRNGYRYQRAMTLVLAGGSAAISGQAELANIGATPMAL